MKKLLLILLVLITSFTTCMYSDVTVNGVTGQIISALADYRIIPFAANAGGTAVSGMTYASGVFTPTLRAGTNNIDAYLAAKPSDGTGILYFWYQLPGDWDTVTQPYIKIFWANLSNTTGTVIITVSSGCTKQDGSVSDDPAFIAESAFTSTNIATVGVSNRAYATGGIFTAMTSGNSCVAGSPVNIKVALTGTAAANVALYRATITTPRKPVLQAN